MSSRAPFSIEAVVLGRNDDYEPGWVDKLHASIAYNRGLFAGSQVDFRVCFVEWNPPAGRPLLAPDLVSAYSFLRAIVIDAAVHEQLCQAADLQMMLNFAYNPALRSSNADYLLITSGDLFYGGDLAQRIKRGGLRPSCIYRAERVNVRADLDFVNATAEVLEDPANVVTIDHAGDPPHTNASGDFIMLDRASMLGIRGFDEGVVAARIGLDTRCCRTAIAAGFGCELLGSIYHVNHGNAYINRQHDYPGEAYAYELDLPYLNPASWGLAEQTWQRESERIWRISNSAAGNAESCSPPIDSGDIQTANAIAARLCEARAGVCPSAPGADADAVEIQIPLEHFESLAHWEGSAVAFADGAARVASSAAAWSYAAQLPLSLPALDDEAWYWLVVDIEVVTGAAGVSRAAAGSIADEKVVGAPWAGIVHIPLQRDAAVTELMIRHASDRPTEALIRSIRLVRQPRHRPVPDLLATQAVQQ